MFVHTPAGYVCPFCLIVAGREGPPAATRQADVVHRDELVTAFVASDWRPNNPGHVVVVPNRHYENLYELPFAEGARLQAVVRAVALAMKLAYKCAGVSTVQHNEPAGDQDVWHYHVHVFPRYVGDELYRSPKRRTTPDERVPYAEKLRRQLMTAGDSEHARGGRAGSRPGTGPGAHLPAPPVGTGELREYARTRDALLGRITEVLASDPRVTAAWLSGSFGRGDDDAWSDFDLHVAVDDGVFAAFLAGRDGLYRRIDSPLLVQHDMASPTQPGSRYQLVVYPGPVEVDWIVGPAGEAVRPRETRMLFARRDVPVAIPPALPAEARRAKASDALIFFWAMAPIAVKYAGRGQSRQASHQIDLLTGAFVVLWRLVEMPDGPDPSAPAQNRGTEAELDARLPRLDWEIDPLLALGVIRGLCAEVERLHPSLEALGVPVPTGMPAETAATADLAEAVVRRGRPAGRRTYR